MISFFKLLSGYYSISIQGDGKERFLNLCRNKKILLWNLKRKGETYRFFVSVKGYRQMNEISEKTNTKVYIEGKYGLPFFLYRNRKRKMFMMGMLLCVAAVFGCSFFIWNIQIKGTQKYTKDEIRTYLTEKNIHIGMPKGNINCAELEEKIREDFEDTVWVSCDIEGTMLTIQVKESIDTSDMVEDKNEVPNDIIASKDGIIASIVTRSGTPLVRTGSEVKKGDTLISGVIYYYNDYDELLETELVSADGDIKAETIYEYTETFPLDFYEKDYTGKEKAAYQLEAGEYIFSFPNRKPVFEKYDKIINRKEWKLGENYYLPFSLCIVKYREYNTVKKTLTEEEAREKAKAKIQFYLNEMKKEGKEIKENDFRTVIENGECRIKGIVRVIESIGKIRNIS